MGQVKKVGRSADTSDRDEAMSEVEDVLRRLAGQRVRLHCRYDVTYENPVVGTVERVTVGQVLLRVHATRIDGIPLTDIVDIEALTEDD